VTTSKSNKKSPITRSLNLSHEISTKLRKGEEERRWIFKLSSTPTKGTQLSLEISTQIMGERGEEEKP
jgi:hypothetical protein